MKDKRVLGVLGEGAQSHVPIPDQRCPTTATAKWKKESREGVALPLRSLPVEAVFCYQWLKDFKNN